MTAPLHPAPPLEGDLRELPIGVFDSGIGGLTVVREVLRQLPAEHVVYFGDSARVTRFSIASTHYLLRRGVKFLVIACNTASALAMTALQRRFDVPMIGVITPGARDAVRRTKNRRIGVIGTTGTINSRAYEKAIAEYDPACSVEGAACPLFVPLAEEGWTQGDVPRRIAETYIAPLKATGVDSVILGCTHYPILRSVIADVLGDGITLIDTAEATVAEVRDRLETARLLRPAADGRRGERRFYLSDVPVRFREIGGRFLGEEIENLTWVEQSDIPWYER